MSRTALRKLLGFFLFNKVQFMEKRDFYVYLLIKDKKPVYVGCSCNVKNRIQHHKKTKKFDSYYILKRYDNKEKALIAENILIRFISVFGDDNWINSKDINLVFDGFHRGFNSSVK